MPEIKSHRTIKTMPMAKKFGAPIFLKKSEKYSTVSITFILSKKKEPETASHDVVVFRVNTRGCPNPVHRLVDCLLIGRVGR